jgi:cytochrome c peroxidase
MFWDNRLVSLETQALGPIESFEEMRGHAFGEGEGVEGVVARLQSNTEYQSLFAGAFGSANAINSQNIASAIAAFERMIIATDSPFDRFQAGDQNAMSQAQIAGMNTFSQVGCGDCHSGPMFSDYQLHTLGVPDNNLLNNTDSGADGSYNFRTPTLRNLSSTGPYFHNGVGGSLQQTIQFYITARNFARNNGNGGGGNGGGGLNMNPNVQPNDIDNDVQNLNNMNNNDIQGIIAFIGALNDDNFDKIIPDNVPSGLQVGGDID